jgi:hypothetical protein
MGFKFVKTADLGPKIWIITTNHIIIKRRNYLRQNKKLDDKNSHFIYLDQTFIHKNRFNFFIEKFL